VKLLKIDGVTLIAAFDHPRMYTPILLTPAG